MISQKEIIDKIDEKTLLDLIQQSFSVNGLSLAESKEIAMAMIFEKNLTTFPSIENDEPIKVYFTHDIDWIYPHHIYSIFKTILFRKDWIGFSELFRSTIFLKNIEKLIAIEESQNIKSIFLVGANHSTFSLERFDIRYTIHNPFFKKLIELLKLHLNGIGLHSQNELNLQKQVNTLEKKSGSKIQFHRSHFLKYDPATLWKELHENEVEIDFSVGNAREVGFKTNIPRHYQATDFINKKVLKTKIIPTILSDNAFFFHDPKVVFEEFKHTLKIAKQFGASVAILFHPENMIFKPELYEYYDEIIHICRNEGAIFN